MALKSNALTILLSLLKNNMSDFNVCHKINKNTHSYLSTLATPLVLDSAFTTEELSRRTSSYFNPKIRSQNKIQPGEVVIRYNVSLTVSLKSTGKDLLVRT